MSEARKTRRASARQQAALRRRRRHIPTGRAEGIKGWLPELSPRTRILYLIGALAMVFIITFPIFNFTPDQSQAITPTPEVPIPTPEQVIAKQYSSPPPMVIDTEKSYLATLETEKGNVKVELYDDAAPNTVNNFVFLAKEGFYDGIAFHRVLPGFMAQGGDPTGTGAGGPGYNFEDEITEELKHDSAGILSMANSGPNTNGSQFFITYTPQPQLDGKHTVFGKVVEGMDLVATFAPRDPSQNPGYEGTKIKKITIEEQ